MITIKKSRYKIKTMNKLIRFTLMLILFGVISRVGFAQNENGTIRGTVLEEETGEPVYGVTVLVVSTSNGTTTDFDGKFNLTLAEGEYDLRISYVSYTPVVIEDVEVESGEVTILDNIRLQKTVEEMEEVVVTAEMMNISEAAMITTKRKSANMLDGISAERFKTIGDSNAAEALKRVTGVSVEGGKYVYVRGLGDRYSKTMMNSVDIPSLDPDKNSLQIDIFPTNLIDNMIITKTAVAEMPADFTGGIVNIETKDFPEEPILNVSFSTNYNPSMHFNSNFLSYDGSSTDFLGFDGGARKLPNGAGIENIPTPISGASDQQVNEFVNSFNSTLGPKELTNPMDMSAGVSLGNQFDVGGGNTLGYILTGTYKRSSNYYDNYQFGEYQTQPDPNAYDLIYATKQNGAVAETNVLVGGMAGLAFKTDRSKYRLTGMHLQNGENRSTDFFIDNSVDAPGQSGYTADSYNLEYSERGVTNFMLNGVHYFNNARWEVNWRISPTFSTMEDPDIRRTTYTLSNSGGAPRFNAGAGGFPSRIWRNMEEANWVGRMDITGDYQLFGDPAKVKFGGSYIYKERDYEILSFDMQFFGAIPTLTGDPSEILQPENIYPNGSIYYQSGNPDPNPNAYNSNVNNLAFYASNEFQLFSNLKTSLGLRVENYVQRHTGRDAIFAQGGNGNNLDNEKVLDALDFFPSANLTYFLTDQQNLRFSYSRTIARPSFKELSFAQILDPVSDRVFNGGLFTIDEWNGNLTETRIHNFDTRWEMFFDRGQLLSMSFFYKSFDNPIELVRIQAQQTSSEFQPRNVGDGQVYGAEFEFRKNLGFISESLTYFHVSSNLTFVQSIIDMTEQEFQARKNREKAGQSIDSQREMAGQAPYIVNAGLSYDNPGIGLDGGLFYNVQGKTLTVVGGGLFPDVYTEPFHNLRLNLNKTLGPKDRASINLSVTNILNDQRGEFYQGYKAEKQIFSLYRPYTAVSLGFEYSF
jgi:outer membrane receptor protein involved in Fe transport